MRESTIEQYLVEQVKALGGEVRKVRWVGRHGAPDRLVMLNGKAIFIELKAPGENCRPHQIREHERMRRMGQAVEVVDSFGRVDEVLACFSTTSTLNKE
jgi:hypothetical protein